MTMMVRETKICEMLVKPCHRPVIPIHRTLIEFLRELLLENPKALAARDGNGRLMLAHAISGGSHKCLKAFLDSGCMHI
jgi:hypothetical protein